MSARRGRAQANGSDHINAHAASRFLRAFLCLIDCRAWTTMRALPAALRAHAPSGALAFGAPRRLRLVAHARRMQSLPSLAAVGGCRGWTTLGALGPPLRAHAPSGALAFGAPRRLRLVAHPRRTWSLASVAGAAVGRCWARCRVWPASSV